MTVMEYQLYAILILQVVAALAYFTHALVLRSFKRTFRAQSDNLMRVLSATKALHSAVDESNRLLREASNQYKHTVEAINTKLYVDNYKRVNKGGEK